MDARDHPHLVAKGARDTGVDETPRWKGNLADKPCGQCQTLAIHPRGNGLPPLSPPWEA